MSKSWAYILTFLLLVLGLQLVVFLPEDLETSVGETLSAQVSSGAGAAAATGDAGPTLGPGGHRVTDVRLVEARPTGKDWELWAGQAVRPQDAGEWVLEKVRVRFFASDGVSYEVSGERGGVQPSKEDLWIEGHVETVSSNGYHFHTERMQYESAKKMLSTSKPVEMVGPASGGEAGLELRGVGMTADLNTNQIDILSEVIAKKELSGSRTAVVRSRRATFSGRSRTALFSDHVKITLDDWKIFGNKADFIYSSTTDDLERLEVDGQVRVHNADKTSTSSSLSIDLIKRRYVFRGSPKMTQGEDVLFGSEIIVSDDGQRVQVVSARAQFDPSKEGRKKFIEQGDGPSETPESAE